MLALARTEHDIPTFLRRLCDDGVLEVAEQRFRFAHDKLREQVLSELPLPEQRELHRQLARAIEAGDPDTSTQATLLAHHYEQAGVLGAAGRYAALAGEQAMQRRALPKQVLLLRAVALLPQRQVSRLDRVRLYRLLLHTHFGLGQLTERGHELSAMLAAIGHPCLTGRRAGPGSERQPAATGQASPGTAPPQPAPTPPNTRRLGLSCA